MKTNHRKYQSLYLLMHFLKEKHLLKQFFYILETKDLPDRQNNFNCLKDYINYIKKDIKIENANCLLTSTVFFDYWLRADDITFPEHYSSWGKMAIDFEALIDCFTKNNLL